MAEGRYENATLEELEAELEAQAAMNQRPGASLRRAINMARRNAEQAAQGTEPEVTPEPVAEVAAEAVAEPEVAAEVAEVDPKLAYAQAMAQAMGQAAQAAQAARKGGKGRKAAKVVAPKAPKVSKFQGVVDYLDAQGTDRVSVTMAELDTLVEGGFGNAAHTYAAYWYGGDAHRPLWWVKGWHPYPRISQQVVVFCRNDADPDPEPEEAPVSDGAQVEGEATVAEPVAEATEQVAEVATEQVAEEATA